jgi:hypothetical protein
MAPDLDWSEDKGQNGEPLGGAFACNILNRNAVDRRQVESVIRTYLAEREYNIAQYLYEIEREKILEKYPLMKGVDYEPSVRRWAEAMDRAQAQMS